MFKNFVHSVIDFILSLVFGIVAVVVVIATFIKINSLKAESYGVVTKKPNYHRRAAIWSTISMVSSAPTSMLAYHEFLKNGSSHNLLLSIALLGLAIVMGFDASRELEKSRAICLD